MRTIDGWMDARAREWMDDVERPRASECHAVPRLARRSMRRACVVYTETLSMPSAPTSRRATTTSRRGVRASERALSTVTAHTHHDEKEINHSSFIIIIIIIIIVVRRRSIDRFACRARRRPWRFARIVPRDRPPPVVIHPSPSARVLSRPSSSWPRHASPSSSSCPVALFRASSVVCANSLATTTHAARARRRRKDLSRRLARPRAPGPGPAACGRAPWSRSVDRARDGAGQIFTGRSALKKSVVGGRSRAARVWLACVDDDDGRASRAIRRSRARVSRGARVGVFAVEDMGMFWVIVCGSWCQGWVW